MKALQLKITLAAFFLCLVSAGAGAQSRMGHGQMGHAPAGGMRVGQQPGVGHLHGGGTFPGVGHFHGGGTFPGVGHFHGGGAFPHHGTFHNGHFVHGFHGGVSGIWWVSGGFWYPWYGYAYAYPYVSYPYTAYPAQDYSGVWYYCQSAGDYYPNVQVCPEGWVAVSPSAPAY